jgi:hypothetical protein
VETLSPLAVRTRVLTVKTGSRCGKKLILRTPRANSSRGIIVSSRGKSRKAVAATSHVTSSWTKGTSFISGITA